MPVTLAAPVKAVADVEQVAQVKGTAADALDHGGHARLLLAVAPMVEAPQELVGVDRLERGAGELSGQCLHAAPPAAGPAPAPV